MPKEISAEMQEELVDWQEECGLAHPPTPFTLEYRKAVQGHNGDMFLSLGYQWLDKPYRLVHNLCQHIEYTEIETEKREEKLVKALEWVRDNPHAHPANTASVVADALASLSVGVFEGIGVS